MIETNPRVKNAQLWSAVSELGPTSPKQLSTVAHNGLYHVSIPLIKFSMQYKSRISLAFYVSYFSLLAAVCILL